MRKKHIAFTAALIAVLTIALAINPPVTIIIFGFVLSVIVAVKVKWQLPEDGLQSTTAIMLIFLTLAYFVANK
jgi:membrane protein implicated in regulation of membrane protease activity